MQIIKGFGFDMLRNQGSYPWSIPNEKDKNKSIMLQSTPATSTPQKQPTQSKTQSQPKKTPAPQPKPQVWETEESYKSRGTSPDFYEEFKKRSKDRMQHFGIGTLRQGNAANVFGNNTATPQKKAPLEVQGELDLPQAKTEGIRRPGIEQVWWKTPQISPMIRKTSAIDPDAEEFTPEGEAAFLEGLASVDSTHTKAVEPAIAGRAQFHPAPAWDSPMTKADDPIVQAGREYGEKILDGMFKNGWSADFGQEIVTDPTSPMYNSRYRQAVKDVSSDRAKADFIAGIGVGGKLLYDIKSNAEDFQTSEFSESYIRNSILPGGQTTHMNPNLFHYALGAMKTFAEGGFSEIVRNYQNLSKDNSRARQSKGVLDYLENNDYRYLVDEEKSRENFIQNLRAELERLKATERLGYLPYEESEVVKQQAVNMLMRIIHLNEQYDFYSQKRDARIREVMKRY